MADYERRIDDHYGRSDLGDRLLDALREAGRDVDALSREDIESFTEFHVGGRDATRTLAELAGVGEGTEVLDAGCGLGGPARTLAAEFGARVTGVDLTEEYCRAAAVLTRRVGLDGAVSFRRANALDLPFADGSFDVVWLQHVAENVADKPELLGEVRRVLRPDGRLAVHEVFAGGVSPLRFPVPFAGDESLSHLVAPGEFERLAADAGFVPREWEDVTRESVEWYHGVFEALDARPDDAGPPLGFNLVMGEGFGEMARTMLRNLEEDRAAIYRGVFEVDG